MEKTLSIFVESLNETWEMGDDMAVKLNEYYKEHPLDANNADEVHQAWFAELSEEEQQGITRQEPEERQE